MAPQTRRPAAEPPADPGSRRPRRRWLRRIGLGLAVVLIAAGVYSWQVGWLSRSYLAATLGCGSQEWTIEPVPADDVAVELEPVSGEVVGPTALAFHPEHDLAYLTSHAGGVHLFRDGRIGEEPVLRRDVSTAHDQGLLGAAVDPDGDWLYLNYTDAEGTSRVEAFRLGADGLPESEGRTILAVDQDDVYHNGGGLTFGPDRLLYATFGDGGVIGDRWGNGQRPDTLLGGVLRIDPTPGGAEPYRIPDGNPWADEGKGAENVALGLRNPYRISFDRETGDLWIGDVGHNCYEEVSVARSGEIEGANFGWNRQEGVRSFLGGTPDRYVPPRVAYPHADDCAAVMGGYVYRGTQIPELEGEYVFGDFCTGVLYALESAGPAETAELRSLGPLAPGLIGFGEGPDGELYVFTFDGVSRLVPTD